MPEDNADLLQGRIVGAYGKRFLLQQAHQAAFLSCTTRGKKTDLACGDVVRYHQTSTQEAVIESVAPRRNLLYRSDAYRSKILAANVDQIVIVLATVPSFYEALLNRCLVAAEHNDIRALIVLNKCDIGDASACRAQLSLYETLGYSLLQLSAKTDTKDLLPHLKGLTSIMVGQSGMGKSTIMNSLLPGLNVRTREVSSALDSGKHTTTASHLYALDPDTSLIDSPGLQEFGLHHLTIEQIEQAFVEFRPFLGKCRFNDCRHQHEPDCAIIAAVHQGLVERRRLAYFLDIVRDTTPIAR